MLRYMPPSSCVERKLIRNKNGWDYFVDSSENSLFHECDFLSLLGTGVFKNSNTRTSGHLLQAGSCWRRDHTICSKSGPEFVSIRSNLREGFPRNSAEALDLSWDLPALELTSSHAITPAVTLEGILGQIIQGFDAFTRCLCEASLISRANSVRRIAADWNRTQGFRFKGLFDDTNPSKG